MPLRRGTLPPILTNISKKYMIKILPISHWPKGTVKSSFFFEKDGYNE